MQDIRHPGFLEIMATALTRHTGLRFRAPARQPDGTLAEQTPLLGDHDQQAETNAPARQRILEASLDAILALLGNGSGARASLALGSEDKMSFVATAGKGADERKGTALDLGDLPEATRALLLEGQSVEVDPATAHIAEPRRPRIPFWRKSRSLFIVPLFIHRGLEGILAFETFSSLAHDVQEGLETLGALVAPALEGVRLNEDLHLQSSRERFRSLVQNSSDVVTLVDIDTTIHYLTPSVERVLGFDPAELVGTKLTQLLHPDDVPAALAFFAEATKCAGVTAPVEWRARHRNGSWLHLETIGNNLLEDPNVGQMVLNTRDISERKALEQQLSHQAFHDPLTDLANRALFKDRVEHALLSHVRESAPLAVLFLDLDNFKNVNDSLGHVVGDELLVAAAKRIQSCLRPGDTAARLGGDEFAILIEDATSDSATHVAERIIESFKAPFTLQGDKSFIQTSVGIAIANAGESADEVLRNADIAMYMAKNSGKGRHAVFESRMHADALERLELESDLRRAVQREEFVLHYQPITDLKTGRIVGMEALVRWQHPERGLLPPSYFISQAEETGLILPLGRLVLQQASAQITEWNRRHPEDKPLFVTVNLSGKQLESSTLVEDVAAVLEESRIDPTTLILEMTESVMMHDTEFAIETLKELKALGIRLAVDDFGTGYSSLHYLHRFPIDILKIAKPFIDCIQSESSESAFIYTIVELCRTLGLQTVAEGVEYGSQAEQLRKLRCEWGQGDYLSAPLCHEEMSELLANGRELSGYAAQVQNTVERREAEWWRRIVGDVSAAA